MKNPIVQAWIDGKNDAGGCIAELERQNAELLAFVKEWLADWTAAGPTDSPMEADARALIAKAEGEK